MRKIVPRFEDWGTKANPRLHLEAPLGLVVGTGTVLPSKLLGFPKRGSPANRVRVLVVDPRMVEGRYMPLETVRGFVEAGLHDGTAGGEPRWEIGYAAACADYGPMVYEAMLEYARRSKESPWVQPSSIQVSSAAERVWQRFRERKDVVSRPREGEAGGSLGCIYRLRDALPGYDAALDRGRRLESKIAKAKGISRADVHKHIVRLGPWFFRAAYHLRFGAGICRPAGQEPPLYGQLKRALLR